MSAPTPESWIGMLTTALVTLVIAAVVLSVIEKVFAAALPALLVVLGLVAVYRLALGTWRGRSGW